jgi:dephospho-CoA kinase
LTESHAAPRPPDPPDRSPVIGVTGGIGAGKTSFARELERLGCRVIDADAVARILLDSRPDLRSEIAKAFGPSVVDASGNLIRSALGRIVFSDDESLHRLNGIVWPPLIRALADEIGRARIADPAAVIVVDMAVLFEAGCEHLFDAVIDVQAPMEARIRRVMAARGWDRETVLDRMAGQMAPDERARRSDWTIRNDGSQEDLRREAVEWYRKTTSGLITRRLGPESVRMDGLQAKGETGEGKKPAAR